MEQNTAPPAEEPATPWSTPVTRPASSFGTGRTSRSRGAALAGTLGFVTCTTTTLLLTLGLATLWATFGGPHRVTYALLLAWTVPAALGVRSLVTWVRGRDRAFAVFVCLVATGLAPMTVVLVVGSSSDGCPPASCGDF